MSRGRQRGSKPGGVPQAYKLPYLGDTAYAVQDANSLLSSISDQGSGKTRVTIDNTATGAFAALDQGLIYVFDSLDTDGAAMSGQHHHYILEGGVRATATDGGVMAQDVQVSLVLFEAETSPLFSSTVEGFGGGIYGITGGLAGPVAHCRRSTGWLEGLGSEATKGDASTRVIDWSTGLAATTSGFVGYGCQCAISRASWASGSDTGQRIADYVTAAGGDGGDSYDSLAVVITSRAQLNGGVGTTVVDVEAWWRAIPRSTMNRDSGFGS